MTVLTPEEEQEKYGRNSVVYACQSNQYHELLGALADDEVDAECVRLERRDLFSSRTWWEIPYAFAGRYMVALQRTSKPANHHVFAPRNEQNIDDRNLRWMQLTLWILDPQNGLAVRLGILLIPVIACPHSANGDVLDFRTAELVDVDVRREIWCVFIAEITQTGQPDLAMICDLL